jgi:hypothetical protein
MTIRELDSVVLSCDLPERGLKSGDVGTVVLVHTEAGYEVEFMTLQGETVAVVSLIEDQLRPVDRSDIPHVRTFEPAALNV